MPPRWSLSELTEAFDTIRPKGCLLPIDATIPSGSNLRLVSAAIEYFTGADAHIRPLRSGEFRVTAEGDPSPKPFETRA